MDGSDSDTLDPSLWSAQHQLPPSAIFQQQVTDTWPFLATTEFSWLPEQVSPSSGLTVSSNLRPAGGSAPDIQEDYGASETSLDVAIMRISNMYVGVPMTSLLSPQGLN